MTTRVVQDSLWSTITDLAEKSKKTDVGVGYLGQGAMSLLVLDEPEDEVLVLGAHLGSLEFVLCELKPSGKIAHVSHRHRPAGAKV